MTLSFVGLVLFALVVLLLVTAKPRTNTSELHGTKPLSDVEQIVYWRLIEACGPDKIILAHVAFSSFIRTNGANRKSKARHEVADFLICNRDFSIFAIVEIDDKTPSKMKNETRGRIIQAAGLKMHRVPSKDIPAAIELKRALGL